MEQTNKENKTIGYFNMALIILIGLQIACSMVLLDNITLSNVLSPLINMTILISYIFIQRKPIVGLMILSLAELINLLNDYVSSIDYGLGIADTQVLTLIVIFVTIVHMNMITSKLRKEDSFYEKNILKRFISVINYEKKPTRYKWYINIIMYSLLITIIMTSANNEVISMYGMVGMFKVYSAIALLLPIISILAMLTVSSMTYEILGFKVLMEIITVILIYNTNTGSINVAEVIFILIEIMILVDYIRNNVIIKEEKFDSEVETIDKDKDSEENIEKE